MLRTHLSVMEVVSFGLCVSSSIDVLVVALVSGVMRLLCYCYGCANDVNVMLCCAGEEGCLPDLQQHPAEADWHTQPHCGVLLLPPGGAVHPAQRVSSLSLSLSPLSPSLSSMPFSFSFGSSGGIVHPAVLVLPLTTSDNNIIWRWDNR